MAFLFSLSFKMNEGRKFIFYKTVFFATHPALFQAYSLFKEGDGVIELNETTFGPMVETTTTFWVIEFYKTK